MEISSESAEKIEVKLLGINGRLLSNLKVVKGQTFRFGEDLHPGVYMVEIKQGQQRRVVKVIKQ